MKLSDIGGAAPYGTVMTFGRATFAGSTNTTARSFCVTVYNAHIRYEHETADPFNYIASAEFTGATIAVGVWTYIGVTRLNNVVTGYVGTCSGLTVAGSFDFSARPPANGASTLCHLTVGCEDPTSGDGGFMGPFVGAIRDVTYYNRALTQVEHNAIMHSVILQSGLVFYSHVGGLSPEPDLAPQGHTGGTVAGTTVVTGPTACTPPLTNSTGTACVIGTTSTTQPPVGANPPFPPIWPYPTGLVYGLEATQTLVRQNSYIFDVNVIANGAAVDLTNATLICSAKWNYTDPDSTAVFRKTLTNGITLLDAVNGKMRIHLVESDTSTIPKHETQLYYDIRMGIGNEYYCVLRGKLLILPEVVTADA